MMYGKEVVTEGDTNKLPEPKAVSQKVTKETKRKQQRTGNKTQATKHKQQLKNDQRSKEKPKRKRGNKMKTMKKLLALILCIVMALGMVSTVMADGTDDDGQNQAQEASATIDATKKGSLTIKKYETGENNTTTPLADVEFTIYKIADIEQTTDSDGNVSMDYQLVDALKDTGITIDGSTTYDTIKNTIASYLPTGAEGESGKLVAAGKGKTVLNAANDTASVTFSNLNLGIYLVVETDAPAQIVDKSANFLVSIPMVNDARNGWDYDVVANPKNEAVYAGIVLHKTGTTLNADGTSSTADLQGVSFLLQYKANEAATEWSTIDTYSTDSYGKITIEDGLAPGYYRFTETSVGSNTGYILDGKTEYTFQVTDAGKIKVGNEEAKDTATIEVNNLKPDLTKKVKDGDSYSDDTDANIGDMVEWKITASVPSNVSDLSKFDLSDTMSSGLTWVSADANLQITTSNSEVTLAAEGETPDYELTAPNENTEGGSWCISFTEAGRKKLAENNISSISVTFSAKLNENATVSGTGNLNTASLTYSNAIYPEGSTETAEEYTIKDSAIVYTFQMNITKYKDSVASGNEAIGVEFELYKDSANGSALYFKKQENGSYVLSESTAGASQTLVTGQDGTIAIVGLESGTYYLKETKTITDYNLLKDPVKIDLNIETETNWTTSASFNDGTLVKNTYASTTYKLNGETLTGGLVSQNVINKKGFTLPITGAMSTLLFSVLGCLLVLAGVIVLFRSGKKKAR